MKSGLCFFLSLLLVIVRSFAQEEAPGPEEIPELESLAETGDAITDEDGYLLKLDHLRKDPLNLNAAEADDLTGLMVLSPVQITNFLRYRNVFGSFIHIYELQAVPGWDLPTIYRMLPFITVREQKTVKEVFSERWKAGSQTLMIRYNPGINQPLEQEQFTGSSNSIYCRYKYNYKSLLEAGVLGDKDSGEPFFKGSRKAGFDFYSFHLFLRKWGIIQAIAFGDFTINLGQGLLQWQSLSFKKSASVTNIKRQSAALRPYTAAGESNFMRGLGLTLGKNYWDGTFFISTHKLTGNLDVDSVGLQYISSFLPSGYHRSASELKKRHNVRESVAGLSVHYSNTSLQVGLNTVAYLFSKPLQRESQPYNLYALSGRKFVNLSIDYAYTLKNYHLFGEVAFDSQFNPALVSGLLVSLHRKVDATFLYRHISSRYQSPGGNAFTENATPVNETGFYAALSVRPWQKLTINLYADLFRFSWLKYLVDAPSYGKDFLLEIKFQPDKKKEGYIRLKSKSKSENADDDSTAMHYLTNPVKASLRIHSSFMMSPSFRLQTRYELSWWKLESKREEGFLVYLDLLYKPLSRPYTSALRLQFFETGSANTRIYAYESGLPLNFSVPQFAGRGVRYYINASYSIRPPASKGRKYTVQCSVSWSQTIASQPVSLPFITEIQKMEVNSELKCQIIFRKN